MPHDLTLKAMNRLHRTILRLSGNRIGWQVGVMPVVQLTTTGRRSGRQHTVLLTSPAQQGRTLVVVASRGGDDRPPAWLLNLQETPEVTVRVHGGADRPMRARVATAQERAQLWPCIAAEHANYAGYQRRTEREIPLVLLEQAGPDARRRQLRC